MVVYSHPGSGQREIRRIYDEEGDEGPERIIVEKYLWKGWRWKKIGEIEYN